MLLDEHLADLQAVEKEERQKSEKAHTRNPIVYKLGQEIKNKVRYFSQEKLIKSNRTAMCICPNCYEAWSVQIANVENGNSKSCGCKK